jgi:hypothetical protein
MKVVVNGSASDNIEKIPVHGVPQFQTCNEQSPPTAGGVFSYAGFGIALVRQLYVYNRATPMSVPRSSSERG